jgi:hypothetical protein
MSEDVSMLLKRYDDPVRGECPAGFDYAAARKRAAAFAVSLERRTGKGYMTGLDEQIQDASFHSQVTFPHGHLRFSSFGDMIALTPDYDLAPEIVEAIRQLAPKHGYAFLPTELLETSYTGRYPGVAGIRTWWIRYFDYL